MPFELGRQDGLRVLALALCLSAAGWVQPSRAQAPSAAQPVAATSNAPATANGERNVYAAGGRARPAGPVRGDFTAAGARVILDQAVGGDAALVGGSVDVRAPVGDDLRAAGGDISIESSVGGELLATGGNITLAKAAAIAGAARVYGGNVTIEGRIDGPLDARAQKVTVNGEVRGAAHIAAADIELGPQARIGGSLTYASPIELKRAEGATIAGAVTRENGPAAGERGDRRDRAEGGWGRAPGRSWAGGVFFFLSLLACTAVLLLAAPSFAIHTSQRIRTTPWLALAVGLGTLLAVPVLAVLLFITLLGIPLGIMVISLYPVLLLAGFVVGVVFIARLIPAAMRQPEPASFGRNVAYVALALVIVMLVGSVPAVGGMLIGLMTLAGIGACVLEVYWRRKAPVGLAPAGGPPAPSTPAVSGVPDTPRHA